MTPYYEDENVTLYHGDCRELNYIGPVMVTDPPYGDTSLDWDSWPEGWLEHVNVLQFWMFGSVRMFLNRYPEIIAQGFKYGQEVVWEKHNGSGFAADRFKRVHELAVHFYDGAWGDLYRAPQYTNDARKRTVRRKTRPTHTGSIENAAYTSEDGGPRLMRSVIQARSEHGRAIHPTQKPEGIVRPLIRYSSKPGEVVYDPFAGSGTTLVVAAQEGRKAVGVEVDERYCETIARRFSQGVLDFGEAS